jgi:iron complex transport system substrate-binding protein
MLLLVTFILISCTPLPQNGAYMEFTDSAGETVYLDKKPERVAVLFSSFADIWVLAGGECAMTVGESVERGIVPNGTPLADNGAGKTLNTEIIIAAEPDLVILSADVEGQIKAARTLKAAGIPCALMRVESFEDYLWALDIFCRINGSDAYEKHGAEVKDRIDTMLSSLPDNAHRDILFIRSGSSAASAKAKTADEHFAAAMLREIGAHNIADDAPVLLDGLSLEAVIKADPDIIFVTLMGSEESARAYIDSLFTSPAWQTLSAVKNGRVVFLPKELFQYKPNANWDKAYEFLINAVAH